MAIKRILVPVDFSADSLSALQYAGEFAKTFKAELLVLYVVEPVYYATPTDMYAASAESAMLSEEQRRVAAEQLTRLGADLKKKGLRFRTMVKDGSAFASDRRHCADRCGGPDHHGHPRPHRPGAHVHGQRCRKGGAQCDLPGAHGPARRPTPGAAEAGDGQRRQSEPQSENLSVDSQ